MFLATLKLAREVLNLCLCIKVNKTEQNKNPVDCICQALLLLGQSQRRIVWIPHWIQLFSEGVFVSVLHQRKKQKVRVQWLSKSHFQLRDAICHQEAGVCDSTLEEITAASKPSLFSVAERFCIHSYNLGFEKQVLNYKALVATVQISDFWFTCNTNTLKKEFGVNRKWKNI